MIKNLIIYTSVINIKHLPKTIRQMLYLKYFMGQHFLTHKITEWYRSS